MAFRLLAPEMYVRVGQPRFHFPWVSTHFSEVQEMAHDKPEADRLPPAIDTPLQSEDLQFPLSEKLVVIESLLVEKNKMIERLQKQLYAERSHRSEFETIKSVMDEEIVRLKGQVKNLKQGD